MGRFNERETATTRDPEVKFESIDDALPSTDRMTATPDFRTHLKDLIKELVDLDCPEPRHINQLQAVLDRARQDPPEINKERFVTEFNIALVLTNHCIQIVDLKGDLQTSLKLKLHPGRGKGIIQFGRSGGSTGGFAICNNPNAARLVPSI